MSYACADVLALSDEEAHVPFSGHGASSSSASRPLQIVPAALDDETALASISALSDDGDGEFATAPLQNKRRRGEEPSLDKIRQSVIRSLNGSCKCARQKNRCHNCLAAFRCKLDELTSLRLRLRRMHKLDMDREALGWKAACL